MYQTVVRGIGLPGTKLTSRSPSTAHQNGSYTACISWAGFDCPEFCGQVYRKRCLLHFIFDNRGELLEEAVVLVLNNRRCRVIVLLEELYYGPGSILVRNGYAGKEPILLPWCGDADTSSCENIIFFTCYMKARRKCHRRSYLADSNYCFCRVWACAAVPATLTSSGLSFKGWATSKVENSTPSLRNFDTVRTRTINLSHDAVYAKWTPLFATDKICFTSTPFIAESRVWSDFDCDQDSRSDNWMKTHNRIFVRFESGWLRQYLVTRASTNFYHQATERSVLMSQNIYGNICLVCR